MRRIDILGLPPEKRAWLEEHPEFLKGLEAEIPRQASSVQRSVEKVERGKAKRERELEEAMRRADELRSQYDPALRELSEKYSQTLPKIDVGALACPQCGDGDHGNKMNDKPWCFKCNVPLVPRDQVIRWLREHIKAVKPVIPPELRGLPDDGGIAK